MAKVVITMRVMPESPSTDMTIVSKNVSDLVRAFSEGESRISEQPIAFGLKALIVQFVMDESKGDTEELEKKITGVSGVQSVEVTDVRRTIG